MNLSSYISKEYKSVKLFLKSRIYYQSQSVLDLDFQNFDNTPNKLLSIDHKRERFFNFTYRKKIQLERKNTK